MATYNTVMKKRNANNDGWDIVLPVSIAENILVGQSQIPLSEYLETKIDKSMIVQNALSTNPDTVASGPALKNVQNQVNTLTNNLAYSSVANVTASNGWTFSESKLYKNPNGDVRFRFRITGVNIIAGSYSYVASYTGVSLTNYTYIGMIASSGGVPKGLATFQLTGGIINVIPSVAVLTSDIIIGNNY